MGGQLVRQQDMATSLKRPIFFLGGGGVIFETLGLGPGLVLVFFANGLSLLFNISFHAYNIILICLHEIIISDLRMMMMRMRGYASMRITRFHLRKKVSWISKAPSSHQTESHHVIINNLLHDRRVNKVCMQTQVHTILMHTHVYLHTNP